MLPADRLSAMPNADRRAPVSSPASLPAAAAAPNTPQTAVGCSPCRYSSAGPSSSPRLAMTWYPATALSSTAAMVTGSPGVRRARRGRQQRGPDHGAGMGAGRLVGVVELDAVRADPVDQRRVPHRGGLAGAEDRGRPGRSRQQGIARHPRRAGARPGARHRQVVRQQQPGPVALGRAGPGGGRQLGERRCHQGLGHRHLTLDRPNQGQGSSKHAAARTCQGPPDRGVIAAKCR